MKLKTKRICSIIMAVLVILFMIPANVVSAITSSNVWDGSVATGFASGTGSETDPYIIRTAPQLAYLAQSVNSGYSYLDKYIKLENDIVLNDTSNWDDWDITAPENTWLPIGCSWGKAFSGTFDGNSHTISGIYIDVLSDYQGFFGYVNYKGTIKNIGVIESFIAGNNNVGGVAGYVYEGTVSNCYNTGYVIGSTDVGGVTGCIMSQNLYSSRSVVNSYNSGMVIGISNVGGVAGYVNELGTVINCYNTGTIYGSNDVGGVAGNNYGFVSNSCNTGEVYGDIYVGGVVGSGDVYNSYNTGIISGYSCVGGISGFVYGNVSRSYNTGTVSGDQIVGSVAGVAYFGNVTSCYYLSGTAADGIGDGTGEAESLTDEQMKDQSNFEGWDFKYEWFMGEVYCGNNPCPQGYPKLQVFGNFSSVPSSIIWNGDTDTNWDGNGTQRDPYLISSAEELAGLAEMVNDGIDYSGYFFKVTKDIVFNNTENLYWHNRAIQWTPIGISSIHNFQGTFDGNGHTISGIYINTTKGNQGLFGYVENGIIRNLGILDSYIKGTHYVGGVGGNIIGSVSNCYNVGTVNGGRYVGGVVGSGGASNCYSTGVISGHQYVGGVTGGGIVINCYNTGIVYGNRNVGGVLGDGSVYYSYNTSMVCGNDYIGGVVGSGSVKNSYNSGIVKGYDDVGGVIGGGTSNNCYNTGAVSGSLCAGGVTGRGNVYNSYNTGMVSGNEFVGSIVGCINLDETITGCYYLNGTASDGIGKGAGEATSLTNEQMKNISSFEGWDFSYDWFMEENYRGNNACPEGFPKIQELGDFSSIPSSAVWNGITDTTWAGEGTQNNPYLITSSDEFAGLAEMVNSGTNFYGKHFRLTKDIVLNNYEAFLYWQHSAIHWTPIGNLQNSFQGIFNGDGHSVRGVFIKAIDLHQGLFGSLSKGIIENLEITDSYISGNAYLGGIAGYVDQSIIKNCSNTGLVSGFKYIGGVSGYVKNSSIENCYNTGTVSGESYVGGISGSGTVVNSYNTGTVRGIHSVGGVMGLGTVSHSCNSGAINGTWYIGGVVGQGNTDNCYNIGTVNGDENVGGVTGTGSASYSYNTGVVSGMKNVGGVAGYADGSVINCYYLIGTAAVGIGTGSGEATALTGEQMKDSSGFIDWDFIDIWEIGVTTGYDYPTLREVVHIVPHEHSYGSEWCYNNTSHWHECIICGDKKDIAEHIYDDINDSYCNICGYISNALQKVLSPNLVFNDGFVRGFEIGSTIGDYYTGDYNIAIYDTKGNVVANKRLATGYTIKLFDNNGNVMDSGTVVIVGDANGDSMINALDYINIRLSILGLADLSSAQFKAVDVNNDGYVKAMDYINLRLYLLGLANINQK